MKWICAILVYFKQKLLRNSIKDGNYTYYSTKYDCKEKKVKNNKTWQKTSIFIIN